MTAYTAIEKAKDGSLIPLCGPLSLHSKYNPAREAAQFAAQFDADISFFVVLGLAGGYHIEALLQRFPAATIIAVEATEDDIAFLRPIPCVTRLLQEKRVLVTDVARCEIVLKTVFRPAEHTKLQLATLRAWEQCMEEKATHAAESIQSALKAISADFSVQSHFGALWQRNIFANASLLSEAKSYVRTISAPTEKIAAIVAAGPSLDATVNALIEQRSRYYIIATDTAYQSLLKRGITADAAVSVDAQMISHAHFFAACRKRDTNSTKTLFVFDLCANAASVRMVSNAGLPFTFIETGHPLSQFASLYDGKAHFPHIETGSGTVTIAAAAFAAYAGFSKLAFFGADFAYQDGKPYTKGCYLDDSYFSHATRLESAEKQFSALMYRTELMRDGRKATTAILCAYKESLVQFLAAHGYANAGELYIKKDAKSSTNELTAFDLRAFCRAVENASPTVAEVFLLPYTAWLQAHGGAKTTHKENLRLARAKTLRYTKIYED